MTQRLVAITGGTGFLGRYCVAALCAAGWRVRLLARRPTHPMPPGCDIQIVPGHMEDAPALARLVDGADALVHCAGLVKAPSAATFHRINHHATAQLATLFAQASPAGRFVLVSTLAARAPHLSAYAASKHAGEQAVSAATQNHVILRPGVIYGPWDQEGIAVLKLARRRLAPIPFPEPRIAMIHARDAAAAIATLCTAGPAAARYELADANPAGYLWRDILTAAAQGKPPRLIHLPDAATLAAGAAADLWATLTRHPTVFGSGKAREILHRDWSSTPADQPPPDLWQPRIDLATGMIETVRWWRKEGQGSALDPLGASCASTPLGVTPPDPLP